VWESQQSSGGDGGPVVGTTRVKLCRGRWRIVMDLYEDKRTSLQLFRRRHRLLRLDRRWPASAHLVKEYVVKKTHI
jgi:hypothetical protein